MPTYIIEHLEPELYEWCIIEYKSISNLVGKENIWFTNIKEEDKSKLEHYGKVFTKSIRQLISQNNVAQDAKNSLCINNLRSVCILDPEATQELKPEDKKLKFFIFGGILGDNPPRKRTGPELTVFFPNAEKRNIGKSQFSTDNAVFVTKQILEGKNLKDLKFQEGIEIKTGKYDSVTLPYLYPLVNNKPRISKELIDYIKKHPNF